MHGQQSMALTLSESFVVGEPDATGDIYARLSADERIFALYAFVVVDDLANVVATLAKRGVSWNLDLAPLYALRKTVPPVRLGGR